MQKLNLSYSITLQDPSKYVQNMWQYRLKHLHFTLEKYNDAKKYWWDWLQNGARYIEAVRAMEIPQTANELSPFIWTLRSLEVSRYSKTSPNHKRFSKIFHKIVICQLCLEFFLTAVFYSMVPAYQYPFILMSQKIKNSYTTKMLKNINTRATNTYWRHRHFWLLKALLNHVTAAKTFISE